MPACTNCGHGEETADAKVCGSCGAALPDMPATDAAPRKKKASFSETLWFQEGATATFEQSEPDAEALQERYAQEKANDSAVRRQFSLHPDKE